MSICLNCGSLVWMERTHEIHTYEVGKDGLTHAIDEDVRDCEYEGCEDCGSYKHLYLEEKFNLSEIKKLARIPKSKRLLLLKKLLVIEEL